MLGMWGALELLTLLLRGLQDLAGRQLLCLLQLLCQLSLQPRHLQLLSSGEHLRCTKLLCILQG